MARGGATTTPTAPGGGRPRASYRKGEVVRAAILDATVELLSERPAHDVGVRDIAVRAGVQHSLVTRHFGSKDALVALAVASVAEGYADAVAVTDDGAAGFVNALRHLSGRPSAAFVLAVPSAERAGEGLAERFPGFAAHLEALQHRGAPDDLRTRVAAALGFGMVTSWNLVEGVLLEAAGIDADDAPEARAVAEELVAAFVDLVTTDRP